MVSRVKAGGGRDGVRVGFYSVSSGRDMVGGAYCLSPSCQMREVQDWRKTASVLKSKTLNVAYTVCNLEGAEESKHFFSLVFFWANLFSFFLLFARHPNPFYQPILAFMGTSSITTCGSSLSSVTQESYWVLDSLHWP